MTALSQRRMRQMRHASARFYSAARHDFLSSARRAVRAFSDAARRCYATLLLMRATMLLAR